MSKAFENRIKEYLDGHASAYPLFKAKYENPKKNIKDCCQYIYNTVQKANGSGVAGCTNGEVFGMAKHYYDEDEIDIGKAIDVRVMVDHHIEITPEEKKELIAKAKQKVIDDEVNRIKALNKEKIAKAKKAKKPEQANKVIPKEIREKVQKANDKEFAEKEAKKPIEDQTSLF